MHQEKNCPFCQIDEANMFHQNDFGLIMNDQNPITKGHSLVIPHHHISSFFDISDNDRKSIFNLVELARNHLSMLHQPEGFHIGFNDGKITGQRIDHLHIHIVPLYANQPLKLDRRWGVNT